MAPSLPKLPDLGHFENAARQLLAAHRAGDARSCAFLRKLPRFSSSDDEDILAARVTLGDTQLLVATHFGCSSWDQLRANVARPRSTTSSSLDTVVQRCGDALPEYAGAGVPLGIVAALNHAGVEIEFMELAAATGWAFSFGYTYDDISPAHMAVRGDPESDGPFEVFASLPHLLGFGYQMARTDDPEALWRFVNDHVDRGTPIMSEHLDGGLITGYQELDGRQQLYFDGTVGSGWLDIDTLHPHAVYVFEKEREAQPAGEMLRRSLHRAVVKGSAHHWRQVPQGMAALEAYLADVRDVTKHFEDSEEWFCWAAFERLFGPKVLQRMAAASAAGRLKGEASDATLAAARHYGRAADFYERYRMEVGAGAPARSLADRARTPERIGVIAPLLEEAIAAEAAGLDALRGAVDTLEQPAARPLARLARLCGLCAV